ncbi:ABC transporter permease [uncultured Sneathiella sp.]|jgi:putative spermidine/putrescine transport system permease protein|uniref:ABC transporter permease n=1 Tax=uncultured Sneathiella sp. TaxID=879315 RepID=UPI0030DCC04D|tara:strand:- start:12268 stop:13452 length:1185 start_codon:yes stop_codon:yes gene_type:complete
MIAQKTEKPVVASNQLVAGGGAFFAAVFGLLFGMTQDIPLIGLIGGLVLGGIVAFGIVKIAKSRRISQIVMVILGLIFGYLQAQISGAIIGAIFGWVFTWFVFWLATGDYRRRLPSYATPGQVLWHHTFVVICWAIFLFLITPIIVVMPLSFNAENFFTFTPAMLNFDPAGYSLKHYEDFFTNSDWQGALKNSFAIAPVATLLSVSLGTLAAIGLSQPFVPFRRAIMAILISPMIMPLIISAAGMYFFYSRVGLQGTYLGVVLAHAALGIPFVIITVTATLVGFDHSLTRAAANLGANPVTTFFRVQMPLILPGVIAGGLFAFITSFDEVVVVLFVGSAGQKTLPWQMFTGLREQISPTILAVATILVVLSILMLTTLEMLRRRSERLRGISPG